MISIVHHAYDKGKFARTIGALRVTPYYKEWAFIGGKRVDVTPMLEASWLMGYDGEPYPDSDALPVESSAALP